MPAMSDAPDAARPPAAHAIPTAAPIASPTAGDLPLVSTDPTPSSPLVRFGGMLGIAGSTIGLIVLVAACAGADRVLPASWVPERYNHLLALSVIPTALGVLGLLIALVGAVTQRTRIGEDTHVMQAAFAGLISLIGGLLEMAVWLRWPIFPK